MANIGRFVILYQPEIPLYAQMEKEEYYQTNNKKKSINLKNILYGLLFIFIILFLYLIYCYFKKPNI